jgi:putative flippase GtrA
VPIAIQFLFYCVIGGFSAVVNLLVFLAALRAGVGVSPAALIAFFIAAAVNYFLSVKLVFRHQSKWGTPTELLMFLLVVVGVGGFDMYCTRLQVAVGVAPWLAKTVATVLGLFLNFGGRRFLVFAAKKRSDWR